ncbi:hypothetical protein [Bacillus cereus]|uniref:Uncharacterized protein n=1 Tax=Bacillus cereus TaxID=1396 RepID=A0A164QDI1_BACCE|nr:hypothetical protein [Bacillus cereus]KZD71156.1 hypothetical protein B4088_0886 [Bacillus cereus]
MNKESLWKLRNMPVKEALQEIEKEFGVKAPPALGDVHAAEIKKTILMMHEHFALDTMIALNVCIDSNDPANPMAISIGFGKQITKADIDDLQVLSEAIKEEIKMGVRINVQEMRTISYENVPFLFDTNQVETVQQLLQNMDKASNVQSGVSTVLDFIEGVVFEQPELIADKIHDTIHNHPGVAAQFALAQSEGEENHLQVSSESFDELTKFIQKLEQVMRKYALFMRLYIKLSVTSDPMFIKNN